MKKHSILFLALLAAVSCQKENTQDIAPVFDSNVELRASFDEQSSRIATEDGLTFSLEEGKEQIGVYIQNDGMNALENVLYTAGASDEQGWIAFTTQMPVQVQSTSKFFAYAPYSATTVDVSGSTDDNVSEPAAAGSGWNGKRAINLPDLQEQPAAGVKTDIAKYYSVVAAPATPVARDVLESYSVNLQFSGVFALVRFGLNNFTEGEIKVSKIVFSAENAALTGYFSVDLTHENPKLSNTEYAPEAVADKTFDKVTVTLAEPATIAAQEMAEVYAVVNACAVTTPKLTVYATDAEGKDIVFEKTLSDKTFSRQQRTAIGVKLENPVAADYAQEVIDALKNGGTVKIEKDVDLSSKGAFEIPAGTTVELIVNEGLTVTANYGQIINNGTMNISGNGLMNISESDTAPADYSAVVTNHGTMTVDGINIVSPNPKRCIGILNDGGDITINDCHIESAYFALECKNGGQAEINGGTFISTSNNTTKDENGNVMCGYCVRVYGAGSEMVVNNATIIGVQGGLASTYGANLIVKDGTFSTYYIDDQFINFYALYVAQDATATVEGGKFYSEGSRAAVMIGNEDVPGGNYGITYLKGGLYEDMGYSDLTKQTIRAAQGYRWQELAEPLVVTNEINGKTNTYYYQIVEGEDLGYKEVEGGYEIYSAKGLQWLADEVNSEQSFADKTIVLGNDIDLEGITWTPIGTNSDGKNYAFDGTFNGQGYTISNMSAAHTGHYTGLFSIVRSGTIENVNIDNAQMINPESNGNNSRGAALIGMLNSGTVRNCKVTNSTIVGYQKLGGLVGFIAAYGNITISGCEVKDITIYGNISQDNNTIYMSGGLVGYLQQNNAERISISGCSVSGIDIQNDYKTYAAQFLCHAFIGDIINNYTSSSGEGVIELDNNTVEQNPTLLTCKYTTEYFGWGGNSEEYPTWKGIIMIDGKQWLPGIEVIADGVTYEESTVTYSISNANGMKWLAEQVNGGDNFSGKTVTLTADIDLENAEWTPIGTTDNPFAGKFDGGSKIISNLNVNSPEEAFKGLFGRLVTPGTISNVNINNAAVTGYDEVGAIVGSAYTGSVSNCHVSGNIAIEGHYHVGGITGYGYATISDCSVIGNAGSYVKGTYMKADFEGDAVGGIIGYAAEKNSAEAKVISECSAVIDVIGTRKVGGIAGQCGKDANVYGCTFSGNVTTNADETYIAGNAGKIMIGGIVGELTGTSLFIKNSTVANGSTVTGVDVKTTGAILGGSRTAGYALTEENNTATGVTVTPDDGVQVSTAEEAVAAIQGGGKVTVAGAIDKIDFTTLNPTAPVELVLNAKVGEIVLGSSASNPAQTTITVAKDVDYPTFSVVGGNDIQNLTIIGDPTSSKACTSGINALNQGITTVKNVTIKGVRFQGKGVHFGFTANPQTTQNIVIEDCEGIDMVEPLFQTSNNKYVNTLVGDITIRNNKATFSASAANTVNALYICVTTAGTVLIENNTFINPPKHGIMADSNACENFIVRGNTFTNPVEDGVKIDYPVNNVLIENNTITPTEYGIRVARFKSDYNPTVTISGNRIDMSNAKDETFNGISIAGSEANGQAKLVIKENVKVGGSVTEWLSINSALVLNDGSDIATPFNN